MFNGFFFFTYFIYFFYFVTSLARNNVTIHHRPVTLGLMMYKKGYLYGRFSRNNIWFGVN